MIYIQLIDHQTEDRITAYNGNFIPRRKEYLEIEDKCYKVMAVTHIITNHHVCEILLHVKTL